MSSWKDVQTVIVHHIEPGIKKYNGVVDQGLSEIVRAAGFQYTPYLFNDGRILLVLPNNLGAFLYKNKDTVFKLLNLAR